MNQDTSSIFPQNDLFNRNESGFAKENTEMKNYNLSIFSTKKFIQSWRKTVTHSPSFQIRFIQHWGVPICDDCSPFRLLQRHCLLLLKGNHGFISSLKRESWFYIFSKKGVVLFTSTAGALVVITAQRGYPFVNHPPPYILLKSPTTHSNSVLIFPTIYIGIQASV